MERKLIKSIYIVGKDPGRLSAFYTDVLGLETIFTDPGRWHQLNAGNVGFAIASAEEAAPNGDSPMVVFETDRPEALKTEILSGGGSYMTARDMSSHGAVTTYCDPEGNVFQIFSRATKQKDNEDQA